jgi:hypothetical protein
VFKQLLKPSEAQSALQAPLAHNQFAAQATAQVPQWSWSLSISTQLSPQRLRPLVHAGAQDPSERQKKPLMQSLSLAQTVRQSLPSVLHFKLLQGVVPASWHEPSLAQVRALVRMPLVQLWAPHDTPAWGA